MTVVCNTATFGMETTSGQPPVGLSRQGLQKLFPESQREAIAACFHSLHLFVLLKFRSPS